MISPTADNYPETITHMTGFASFGPQHILWLLILITAGTAAVRFFPAGARNAGAVLAILGRILPGLYEIGKGTYGLSSLPLHVCAMAGYGCFLHRVLACHKSRQNTDAPVSVLSELLFFPGLPGAILALLFPGWGYLPPFSFLSACEFLGHFGIVLYVLTSMKENALSPSRKRAYIPVCFCILYFAILLPFDLATGMNYGFLLQPSPDSPLSWIAGVAGGGIGYYVLYALIVLGAQGLCYALL